MSITTSQVKEIRQEFARLKPATATLDGNRAMTVKQAIFTLLLTSRMMNCEQELTERRNHHVRNLRIHPRVQYGSE
ncbi:MAG TPA: hypothetical protein H9991_05310 [Candidatus Mailhella excrementigallinarum]|nr:hypothetical protein [Candidatus Mailhella excrementigallinarum]